jgi:hypothetical protein
MFLLTLFVNIGKRNNTTSTSSIRRTLTSIACYSECLLSKWFHDRYVYIVLSSYRFSCGSGLQFCYWRISYSRWNAFEYICQRIYGRVMIYCSCNWISIESIAVCLFTLEPTINMNIFNLKFLSVISFSMDFRWDLLCLYSVGYGYKSCTIVTSIDISMCQYDSNIDLVFVYCQDSSRGISIRNEPNVTNVFN